MDECRKCGESALEEVRSFEQVEPVATWCTACGAIFGPPVRFERTRLEPFHMIDPDWSPVAEIVRDLVGLPARPGPRVVTLWLGPLVDRPQPPTPEQILEVARLIGEGRVFIPSPWLDLPD